MYIPEYTTLFLAFSRFLSSSLSLSLTAIRLHTYVYTRYTYSEYIIMHTNHVDTEASIIIDAKETLCPRTHTKRDREREREAERQRGRERVGERERARGGERERGREEERQRGREEETETEREKIQAHK
jgi:hypothetical protein